MAFTPPQNNAEKFSFKDGCPYLGMDPSGQPKCEADDIMEEYLPGTYPPRGGLCLSSAENWIDCVYSHSEKFRQ